MTSVPREAAVSTNPWPRRRNALRDAALGALAGFGYWLAIGCGVWLSGAAGAAQPIWLADGFALGFWFAVPATRRLWQVPALFIAHLWWALDAGQAPAVAAGGAAVNALQLAVAAWLIGFGRMRHQSAWDGTRRLLFFIFGVVGAINGVMALLSAAVFHFFAGEPYLKVAEEVFIADALGLLIVTPFFVSWSEEVNWRRWHFSAARGAELVLLFVLLALAAIGIFSMRPDAFGLVPPLFYLGIPLVLWAALRFELRGATLAIAEYSLIAMYYTMHDVGPFVAGFIPTEQAVLQLQGFLAVLIGTTLTANALVAEQRIASRKALAWQNRYAAAIRASGSLVYEIFPHTGVVSWSGDTQAVLGVPLRHISNIHAWSERVHPDDRAGMHRVRAALLSGEVPSADLEYRVRRDDGSYLTVDVNAYGLEVPLAPGDAPAHERRIVGFLRDVTARKRAEDEKRQLEERLKQAQKMEAIGRLAGGIAHDFNNLLGAILGYGEMARDKLAAGAAPPESPLHRYVETILAAGERGKALVAQILTFSRARPAETQPVLVAALLEEIVALVEGSLPAQTGIVLDMHDRNAMVAGEVTQLHQLVMNLCTNAIHAMPKGGTLAIGVDSVRLEQARRVQTGGLAAGAYVTITIEDKGAGMEAGTLSRIFDPFYTTKPAGRGTGLGLALAQNVAQAHGGGIDVVSHPGAGSTFTVYLPELSGEYQPATPPVEALPRGHGETILVVDDEPPLLALAEDLLAELGYEPVGFTSSAAALEAFESAPRRFDAILSDEVMPELAGTDLCARVRTSHPELPVILVSGYGGPGFEIRAQSAGVTRILPKPYHRKDIAYALAAVLGTR